MIEFANIYNVGNFSGNPILAQHYLRYSSIIKRQNWSVPHFDAMEFDEYDNPAAKYLVYRSGGSQIAIGSSRLYPTSLPYMLEQKFSDFVTGMPIPKSNNVWEGSRFCVSEIYPAEIRKRVVQEIVIAYLEVGLEKGIDAIVGLMYPAYWRSIFINNGWDIEFMGDVRRLDDGNKARAAWLPISEVVLRKVRDKTGIHENVVNYGVATQDAVKKVA